ncbi:MAG: Protein tolB [Chlamydiales bacterium]|jgi:TolB protein|nr:Protein tolB [Chlamydiales bacterium]
MERTSLLGIIIGLCLAFNSHLFSIEGEIVVQLGRQKVLKPTYVAPVKSSSDHNSSYLLQVQKIMEFDFNHNGSTVVIPGDYDKKMLLEQQIQAGRYEINPWRNQKVKYVIAPELADGKLSALIISVNDMYARKVGSVPVSGQLKDDRRQIHKLSDMVYKALFNSEGIATTRILYTVKVTDDKDPKKWWAEVWEADYDGGNPRFITREHALVVTPVYLPPQAGLAGSCLYVSYRIGQPKIFITALKDGKGERFSTLRGNQLMPTVSPQRDKFAFICDANGNPDLYIQDFDPNRGLIGKPHLLFTARNAAQGSPTFSPDGQSMVFVSNKDGVPRLYLMQIPSSNRLVQPNSVKLITRKSRDNTSPAWSPDGKKIAYSAKSQGIRQIWLYDLETGQEQELTTGGENKENPTWAPNSVHIAFNTAMPQSSEIYITDIYGSKPVKITVGSGEKRFPCWEPRNKHDSLAVNQ